VCVFLIGVICSCREIYTTKAYSAARDENIPHADPCLVEWGGRGGRGAVSGPPYRVLNQV
jgi:hypothetical protein